MENDQYVPLINAMGDLDETLVLETAIDLRDRGESPCDIFKMLLKGIDQVNALYESGVYFLADLIMARHILQDTMENIRMYECEEFASFGRIMIATVKDDIHSLAKDVIIDVLRYNGFEVIDLGVDVTPERIVKAVSENLPDILILSGNLNDSPARMIESIMALEASGLRNKVHIIVGGTPLTEEMASAMGADAFSGDVMDCMTFCHDFMAMKAGGHI